MCHTGVSNCCRKKSILVIPVDAGYSPLVPGNSPFRPVIELMFGYNGSMASSRKRGRGVGPPKFTYETRIRSFRGVSPESGVAALSAYAALYGRLERKLFADVSRGRVAVSLKRGYLSAHRIPARMFNSLRVSVEGKIAAARESQLLRQASLARRIARAETRASEVAGGGKLAEAHQKKRRLAALRGRLEVLERDIDQGRIRICFGSRKLWRKQFNLEANGYESHSGWLADWREARSDEFFVLGSRDERSGCQLCVATVQDDGLLSLRLRMPDALSGEHGKYLVTGDVHFNHGHAQVLAALLSEDGQSMSYRFKRDRKGWRVFATVAHERVAVVTDRRLGAIGVDVNVDHLAVSETDASGNWVRSWRVPVVTYGKSPKRAGALTGDSVARVVARAREAGKPLVIEDLDFSKKKDLLEGEASGRSRMLSSFAYGRIKAYFLSRGYREGVEVCQVNPAFSSVIGRVKFMERYGLSVHQAAALVLARRLLGCSERVPRQRDCPADGGVRVTFTVPARKRLKHVWTLWGAISRQLGPAHAELRRRGGGRPSHPAWAGPPVGTGLGCDPFGAPG